jgi:hypothetical protein
MSLTKSNTRMLEGDIDASNITGVLPVANGGTGSSTAPEAASSVFSESFESSEIDIPASDGFLTATHGLGSVPKLYLVCLRCKTAEAGYAVGDETNLSIGSAYRTSTEISFLATSSVTLYNKTTGVYGSTITNSNWKIVFRAFA